MKAKKDSVIEYWSTTVTSNNAMSQSQRKQLHTASIMGGKTRAVTIRNWFGWFAENLS